MRKFGYRVVTRKLITQNSRDGLLGHSHNRRHYGTNQMRTTAKSITATVVQRRYDGAGALLVGRLPNTSPPNMPVVRTRRLYTRRRMGKGDGFSSGESRRGM